MRSGSKDTVIARVSSYKNLDLPQFLLSVKKYFSEIWVKNW